MEKCRTWSVTAAGVNIKFLFLFCAQIYLSVMIAISGIDDESGSKLSVILSFIGSYMSHKHHKSVDTSTNKLT